MSFLSRLFGNDSTVEEKPPPRSIKPTILCKKCGRVLEEDSVSGQIISYYLLEKDGYHCKHCGHLAFTHTLHVLNNKGLCGACNRGADYATFISALKPKHYKMPESVLLCFFCKNIVHASEGYCPVCFHEKAGNGNCINPQCPAKSS